MRIALVLEHFDPARGGLENQVARWAAWLAARGHEVAVVCQDAKGDPPAGITFHSPEGPPPRSPLAGAARLSALASGTGADVVHDFGAGLGGDVFHPLYGARGPSLAGHLLSFSALGRLRQIASPFWLKRQADLLRLERLQTGDARRLVVACSRKVESDLVRRGGTRPGQVRVVYNAVDGRPLRGGSEAARLETRAALEWPEGTPVFLQVAHNMRLKGVETSVRALALLHRQGLDAMLAVAGHDRNVDRFRSLARRLGVESRVSFLGRVADVAPVMRAADVFLHPARYDACSLALLEALAAGLPVAISTRDGASELVTDGVQGWHIRDPRDAAEVSFKMKLLLDPGWRGALAAQAAVLGAACDQEEVFPRLERLCAEAATRPRLSAPRAR